MSQTRPTDLPGLRIERDSELSVDHCLQALRRVLEQPDPRAEAATDAEAQRLSSLAEPDRRAA